MGWRATAQGGMVVVITAPDRRRALLVIEPRARLTPKDVRTLVDRPPGRRGTPVVVSPFLSESTRARLRESGFGYLDTTGNARIVLSKPGLFIETQGATEDPDREERPARSLRGVKAGRIARALVELRSPPRLRSLATGTRCNVGYVSRVVALLDSEALIRRSGRGQIESVDWPALLRRWALESPLESRARQRAFLEPRGIGFLLPKLVSLQESYAITGSIAAASLAPLAPARLATVWVRDADTVAARLGLRPADAGANVVLAESSDDAPFEGSKSVDGLVHAAAAQVAADLLTSPGRGPQEGEALIEWMQAHEGVWRRDA